MEKEKTNQFAIDPEMSFANVLWQAFGYSLPEPPLVFIRVIKHLMAKEGFALEWVKLAPERRLEPLE